MVGTMNLAEINDAVKPILVTNLITIAGFILIGLAVSYSITRSISRPLKELVEVTEKVSQGDLTQSFNVKNNDEISQVGISFNKMVIALKDLIQHVGEKSDQLASSSEQLTASAEQNNHATEQVPVPSSTLRQVRKNRKTWLGKAPQSSQKWQMGFRRSWRIRKPLPVLQQKRPWW